MYRSEKLYKKIDSLVPDNNVWPVCIPSYNRPNGTALRRLLSEDNLDVYLFIRSEQIELYRKYQGRYHIIKLNNVHDIGETRRSIVRYGMKKKWSHLFMLDDDIEQVDFIVPWYLRSGKEAMVPWSTVTTGPTLLNTYAFKMWQYLVHPYLDTVAISSPYYKRFCWSKERYENIKPKFNIGQPIQCVHLNLDLLREHGINYQPSSVCGVEDYAIAYECYKHGLRTLQVPDIVYSCPAMGSNEGGCDFSMEILENRIKLFMSNVVKPEDIDKFTTKISKSGVPSVKFKWREFMIKGE